VLKDSKKKDIKNKLQYAYTVSVFLGVFFTAYLMMSQEGFSTGNRGQNNISEFRMNAVSIDPAIIQLLEMQKTLTKLQKDKSDKSKRALTFDEKKANSATE
jgi:hypothetical protein